MEIKYLSIFFSVCGIASLFFLSLLSEPVYVDLSEISKYEGKEIITEGIVVDKYETKYRNTILFLVKALPDRENNTITTFIDRKMEQQIDTIKKHCENPLGIPRH